jgi:hypothetical protein
MSRPVPFRHAALALAVVPLAGCLTLSDGAHQSVAVTSSPPGASCQVASAGTVFGTVTTPATVTVARTSHDIDVSCARPGYMAAAVSIPPNSHPNDTVRRYVGTAGILADLTTGAVYHYPAKIDVLMWPEPAAPAPARRAPAPPRPAAPKK